MKKSIITGSFVALSLIFSGLVAASNNVGQQSFDGAELKKFIKDYSVMTQWKAKDGHYTGDLKNAWVMAGMQYDDEFAAALKEKGWGSDRFFYLLNHVRQGVMQERHRQRQQKIEEKINLRMADMAAKMSAQQAAFEKQVQDQAERAEAWIRDQLEAQKKQVRSNPYMHPLQKRRILDFLNRSSSEAKWVTAPKFDFDRAQAKAEAQRKAWEASFRRSIQNNPNIPAEQKRVILEGMDKVNQPVAAAPAKMPSQEEMAARIQERRSAWIAQQIEQIKANPAYSDEQEEKIIRRLQRFSNMMTEGTGQKVSDTFPGEEEALIKENIEVLVKLLSRKQ
jgi:hypothetical protein